MKQTGELNLRLADSDDSRFLYELRNDTDVRRNSFQMAEILYEHHKEWFAKKLLDKNSRIYIMEENRCSIGQVRVDRQGQKAEISYALCKEARGRGLSKWMLLQLESRLGEEGFCRELIAEVKGKNTASRKIFQSLGYKETEKTYGFGYRKEIPLFSILMCTYNSGRTLQKALDSVRDQEFENWELVILDNGSGDDSISILQAYEEMDARIHCIYQKGNVGWRKGIGICLEKTAGRYMMFLGADDYLASEQALWEVAGEIAKNQPDIVWTGCGFAVLENGKYTIAEQKVPPYRIYETEDKLQIFSELMQNVYYNSVMHYVKIDFLKECGIDFYQPYYGDCEGMTEAIAKAGKMVVMDQMLYILTTNTSQTVSRVFFEYNTERQWQSICKVIPDRRKCPTELVSYVAQRVLNNLVSICQSIVLGDPLTDSYMNPIERNFAERFLRVEEMISGDAMAEMMYYGGREIYAECLIGASGVAYWNIKKYGNITRRVQEKSLWLAEFVEQVMEMDKDGQIAWKTYFTGEEGRALLAALEYDHHLVGLELLLKDNVQYEDEELKHHLKEMLKTEVIR